MKTILISTVATLALSAGAYAQTGSGEAGQTTQLETLFITTPLRRESTLKRSTSSVTVIDEEEIKNSGALDLVSFLQGQAGVSLAVNGGMGANAGLSLRGTKATQTLVLINGINVRSATAGTTSVFNIPLDSIERIEIAKGAHSAQYGSDAIGGVVNIITKGGGDCTNGNSICTTLSTGVSYPWGGHIDSSTSGRTADGIEFTFGGRFLGTRGYDFTTATTEPDDDGFRQGSGYFSAAKEFGWGRLYTDLLVSRALVQYDDAFGGANESKNTLCSGKSGVRFDHAADWSTTVEIFSGLDYQKNYRKGTITRNVFDTTRYGVFAATEKSFEAAGVEHVLNAGVEAYREKINSTQEYDETKRDIGAVFAQYSMEVGALSVDSGIRYDKNDQYGSATTYNIGASYEFIPGLVGRTSYATGFRAPTFNDLYYPGYGNPDLLPERSRSYEVGLRWQPMVDTVFDAAFYQTWLKDAIGTGARFIPENIDRVKNTGFEASLTHRFDERWRGRLEVAFNDPKDQKTGLVLIRQDRYKAVAEVGFAATQQLDLTASLVYVGPRYDTKFVGFTSTRVELSDYITMDMSALYRLNEQTEFRFSVENLFDKQYSTVEGYRAPGRSINVSLSRTF